MCFMVLIYWGESLLLQSIIQDLKQGSMKKVIIVLMTVLSAVSSYGIDKKIEKFVGKYDVAYEAKNLPQDSPEEFWKVAMENNKRFSKFEKNIKKGRGAEKQALREWNELPRLYPQYDESISPSWQPYCDSLLNVMGISGLDLGCNLYVIDTNAVDLYTMLTENGFAICMTEGLISMKGVDDDVVMGFVAHEFVHGAYRHYLQKLYDDARKSRKNNIIMGMVAVGTIGAIVAIDAALPDDGRGDIYYFEENNTTINNPAPEPLKYAFLFSKDQVMEADLVAFRFMENMGCQNAYLNGLKILSPVYETRYSGVEEVLPITQRINFIKYMEEYPGLGLE